MGHRQRKRLVSVLLCFTMVFALLPLSLGLSGSRTDAAAYYDENERFNDFENLDASISVGDHAAEPPVLGQAVNSSNNTAATLNNWRSNASAGVWSIGSDNGNVGMYFNGTNTSTSWIVGYSANDVLMSASVKLRPHTPTTSPLSTTYFGLAARVLDNNNLFALAIRKLSATQYNLVLLKRVSGTNTELSVSAPIDNFIAGQSYRMTFQISGNPGNIVLNGSIEGGPTVTATVTDNQLPSAGSSVGLFGLSKDSNMRMYVDDIVVKKMFPSAPTGVTVISAIDSQVALRFSGAADSDLYYVKRANSPSGPFTTLGTVTSGTFRDVSASNGSTYYYAIASAAKTKNGQYLDGSLSTSAIASPQASAAVPPAPGWAQASIRDTEIGLTWNETPDTIGYIVKRVSSSTGPLTVVGSVYSTETSFLDQGLTVNQDYYYTVSAYNQTGESVPSDSFYGRTAYPPVAPANLTAIPNHSSIKLQWESVTDAVYYTVQRSGSSGGSYTVVGSNLTRPSFIDSGLQNGQMYYYVVQAMNAVGGSSLDSNEASAMPQKRYTFTETQVTASDYDRVYNGDTSWGNKPSLTVDNNPGTRWGANGVSEWIQYDLGAVSTVDTLGIAFYKGSERSYSFSVLASANGSDWTPIFSGQSRGSSNEMEAFDLPDTDARYVRIVAQGNSATNYNGYMEVHIYSAASGSLTLDPIPPATPGPTPNPSPRPYIAGLYDPDGQPHNMPTPNPTTGSSINVKDVAYGAVGNGIADDTAAIQRAIDAAQPGDEVYLPNGIYKLMSTAPGSSDTHLKLKSGVNFRGESQEGTVLLSDFDNRLGPDNSNTGLSNPSSRTLGALSVNSITISNLTLTSTWDNVYPTNPEVAHPLSGGVQNGIYIDKSSTGAAPYNIVVDGVTLEKFVKTGIRMAKGQHLVVRNSTFRKATDIGGGGSGYGIALQGDFKNDRFGFPEDSQYNLIENNVFDGTDAMRHGIIVQAYSHNNLIRDNLLMNTTYDAIDLHGEDEYLNEVYNNVIMGTRRGAGIALGNTGGGFPSNHSESGPYNLIHYNTLRNNMEGIAVVLGSPDTIVEHNTIEIDPSGFVRGPYQQQVTGIKVLNGPRTIVRNNTISNFAATDTPIALDYDNGDSNANQIGSGDPRDVQLIGNIVNGSVKGIEIRKGSGHVVMQDAASQAVPVSNTSGNPVYEATTYAGSDTRGVDGQPFAAAFQFDLEDASAIGSASLQLSGRLTDVNPGGETITLKVFGMPTAGSGTPTAADAANGIYLGEFTMAGFKANTYNLPYNVNSYNVATSALTQYLNSKSGDQAVILVVDAAGQGVPIELYSSDHRAVTVRPLLKTAAPATTDPGNPVDPGNPSEPGEPGDPGNPGEPNNPGAGPTNPVLPPDPTHVLGEAGIILPTQTVKETNRDIAEARAGEQAVKAAVDRAKDKTVSITAESVKGAEEIRVYVNGNALQHAQKDGKADTVAIVTELGSYRLPIDSFSQVKLGDQDEIVVTISVNNEAAARAQAEGMEVAAAIDFSVQIVKDDGTTEAIASFKQYVSRIIQLDRDTSSLAIAVVRVEKDATGAIRYTPVPFRAAGDAVTMYSRTNSTYMILKTRSDLQDISTHWAKEQMERMAERKIVQGVTDSEFRPELAVTRAEFASLVTRTLGVSPTGSVGDSSFSDVRESDWYFGAVSAAAETGIVSGYEDGTFQPNRTITRQEMAVMIYRAMQYAGTLNVPATGNGIAFSDADTIQSWAQDAVANLTALQIVNGVGEERFAPNDTATRAQSTVILYRMLTQLPFMN
ncbi:S-layer homology domain-containing protein [Paenibacillus koleovorans]|uniref:S-layer homology domain-containing protein n=1 Tax=Paenibacillus koleovorans TaxID=121608 RepID=UPI000FDAB811|nr:S-layer homology domain-containing protein [Paenibacillus koleovorans]